MTTALERILQGPPLEITLYPPTSRSYGLPLAEITLADGRTVRYLRRRFLPDPSGLVVAAELTVVDGDRLDNLAARHLGDPLVAWRIADANRVLRMEAAVEETGRRIRIAIAGGLRVNPNA